MRPSLADLSIVVVTWHSAEDVPALLASLRSVRSGGAELVMVENGSGDGTPGIVRAIDPGAVIVENRENRGFAAAANQGCSATHRPFVLFLNPDTVVEEGAVARALARVGSDPSIGVLGCRTLNADGTPQPTVDRFYSVAGLVAQANGERRWGSRPRGIAPTVSGDVDWVYGSFMMCRRDVLAAVGGFDEGYEMYGEDLDLCHRVHEAGYRVVYLAEAVIVHRGNRSGAKRYGAERDLVVLRSTLRFFRCRRGAAAAFAFRALAGASFALKALCHGILSLTGDQGASTRARMYARMAWLCVRGGGAGRQPSGWERGGWQPGWEPRRHREAP